MHTMRLNTASRPIEIKPANMVKYRVGPSSLLVAFSKSNFVYSSLQSLTALYDLIKLVYSVLACVVR